MATSAIGTPARKATSITDTAAMVLIISAWCTAPRSSRASAGSAGGSRRRYASQITANTSASPITATGAQDVLTLATPLTGKLNVTGSLSSKATGAVSDALGGLLGGKPGRAPATKVPAGAKPAGSLSDLIPGGLLGGAAAGSVLSGGLGKLIKELQDSGHGRVAQSWVDTGQNQEIAPQHLADALGSDTLDALSQQTGLGREDLLAGLSQHLPDLIDQLTPNGRLPNEEEAHRMV